MRNILQIWRKGEITVFVSLMLAVFLFFFQICLQSARYAFLRSQTEEALELAESSVLSEYHRELLERYELFYLDLGYGAGAEDTEYLKQRTSRFLNANLPEGETKAVEAWDLSRATDGNGMGFYEQAVSCMKQKTGVLVLEAFREYEELGKQASEKEGEYSAADARESSNLEELKQRRIKEEQGSTPDPVSNTNALKSASVLHLILKEPALASGKKADLSNVPSVRSCLSGAGPRGKYEGSLSNDVFFHAYLQEHFSNAVDFMVEGEQPGSWLDYQVEYIIAGKDSDIENLEHVCGRLLAMREGINYAYLLTDTGKAAECEALAAALVGATMIPGLVEAMKQVLLLAWAFAESVVDVRMLLEGKRVDFWKSGSTWRTSLTEALKLGRAADGAQGNGDTQGLSYEDYLSILLTLSAREKKTYRSLDIIEGVIRGESGNKRFYIDQCVDSFWLRTVIFNGREWSAQRWFCYEW